jgi:hypothetical protein
MKRRILTLIGVVIALSCAEEVVQKPENLIPRQQMTDLLYELAILNSAKGTNKALMEKHFESPTDFLFTQYGIDSLQFVKSDFYYASQPLVYEAIYKEVSARLERQKELLDEEMKLRNDSLMTRSMQIKDSLKIRDDE